MTSGNLVLDIAVWSVIAICCVALIVSGYAMWRLIQEMEDDNETSP